MRNIRDNQSGSILVSILIIMIFLTMTVMSLAVISQTNITRANQRIFLLQAQYAAESGADVVVAYLNSSAGAYADSGVEKQLTPTSTTTYRATYQSTVTDTATSMLLRLTIEEVNDTELRSRETLILYVYRGVDAVDG